MHSTATCCCALLRRVDLGDVGDLGNWAARSAVLSLCLYVSILSCAANSKPVREGQNAVALMHRVAALHLVCAPAQYNYAATFDGSTALVVHLV